MQARGCTGIEYMQPGVAGGSLRTTPVPPTLGFWVYAAIIGGVLLGAALVLVVVHSILKTRPIDPNALQVRIYLHHFLNQSYESENVKKMRLVLTNINHRYKREGAYISLV